jgi:hypothetical protein
MVWTKRIRFPAGNKDFSLIHSVQTDSTVHQSFIQWVPGALPLTSMKHIYFHGFELG